MPSVEMPHIPANPIAGHPVFEMVSHINRGRHGFVVLARDKTSGEEVAIKFLERKDAMAHPKYLEREIFNQYKLCHPHIIRLIDVFLTPKYLAIVMEYANLGDLHSHVMSRRGIPEAEARWFFQQLIVAVDFMQTMGVVNRDIKLENTLLAGDTRPLIKLADFGFSKDEQMQSAPTTRVGTVMYMAPEIVTKGANAPYDARKADMWSCGVVLYAMLTGSYPFKRPEDAQQGKVQGIRAALKRIMSGDFVPPENVSPDCLSLLLGLLCVDPNARLGVVDVMRHPWYIQSLAPGVAGYNATLVANAQADAEKDDEMVKRMKRVLQEMLKITESLEECDADMEKSDK